MKRNAINTDFAYCTGKGSDFCEFCERSVRYYREAWEAVRNGSSLPEDRGACFITNRRDESADCCCVYIPAIAPDEWKTQIPRPKDYREETLNLPQRHNLVKPTKRRTPKK